MNNTYGLERIQSQLLEALILFDKICRENSICYSLHGGTLLGAVGNQQFIPWDDDADVSMTRKHYNQFKKILKLKQYENIELREDIFWISRFIYNTNSGSVFVDIFIYDFITENKVLSFCKVNLLRCLQGMIKSKENLDFTGRNIFYKFSIVFTYLIGRLLSNEKKFKWYHILEERIFVGNRTKIHRSNDTFYGLAHIHDKEFMENYVEIILEGHFFMANKRYKEFLLRSYGADYLTPPPEKDRRPQHAQIRNRIEEDNHK